MKSTSLLPVGVAAIAFGCASLAASSTPSIAAGPMLLGRGDLTLLPGPHLLSPARGTPQLKLVPTSLAHVSEPGAFRFVSGTGTPPASSARPAGSAPTSGAKPAAARAKKLPDAESLRFDAKL